MLLINLLSKTNAIVTNKNHTISAICTSSANLKSPGTRRFLRIFSCVVTYGTGAKWCLYMITSADVVMGI